MGIEKDWWGGKNRDEEPSKRVKKQSMRAWQRDREKLG